MTDSNEQDSIRAAMRERLAEAVKLSIQLGQTQYFLPEAADALNSVLRGAGLEHLCITPGNIAKVIEDLALVIAADAQQQEEDDEEEEEEEEED